MTSEKAVWDSGLHNDGSLKPGLKVVSFLSFMGALRKETLLLDSFAKNGHVFKSYPLRTNCEALCFLGKNYVNGFALCPAHSTK